MQNSGTDQSRLLGQEAPGCGCLPATSRCCAPSVRRRWPAARSATTSGSTQSRAAGTSMPVGGCRRRRCCRWGSCARTHPRGRPQRRAPGLLGAGSSRESGRPAAHGPAGVVRAADQHARRSAARGGCRADWLAIAHAWQVNHGGGPGLRRRPPGRPGDAGPREAWQAFPPHRGRHADPAVPRPPGRHGGQRRPVGGGGRPGLDLRVGPATLAGPAQPIYEAGDHRHPASCGGGGDRTTRPWAWRPAAAWCAPTPPADGEGRAAGQARRSSLGPPGTWAAGRPAGDQVAQDRPVPPVSPGRR
jgi:hypothetical protein